MADIAGFYCAFGLTPNRAAPERVDCIALEIEFTAIVLERWRAALGSNERAGVCEDALRAFETDHLCWWAPTFGRLLEKRATDLAGNDAPEKEAGLFRLAGVAKLLCGWLAAERTALGIEPRRRLIEPSVAPLEDDNGCGSCSGCATDTASSACPS
jgi:hypothetical protein